MNTESLKRLCDDFLETSGLNRVDASLALRPELAGMAMFEPPLLGVAKADDPLFDELLRPGVVGPHFRLPKQWTGGAASVVSLFFPHTPAVSKSNRADPVWASDEWLHARIEGQEMIDRLTEHAVEALRAEGHEAVAPSLSPEFTVMRDPMASNWSERHVAYVAGLGTFGISSVFISEKGASGRLSSIVTSLPLPVTERRYDRYDAYCTRCGACVRRCTHGALSMEGKDRKICAAFLMNETKKKFAPRYGCGKCYVGVPCEKCAPGAR